MKRTQSTALLCLVSTSLRLSLVLGAVGVFASVGSAASTSKDTYYVNDHLATTVATSDAAGEIAQIESDAFGTQAGAVAKDSRFTGKPYDADMGAYVFPFRNYRSDEARWMSADPSGFPNGNNATSYAPNPLMNVDAFGLNITHASITGTPTSDSSGGSLNITVTTGASWLAGNPESGNNVKGYMHVNFGSSSGQNGWVVQHILDVMNVSDANGYVDQRSISFWEAWRVNSDGSVEGGGLDEYVTDTYSQATHGSLTTSGWAAFFTDSQVSSNNPATWLLGNQQSATGFTQIPSDTLHTTLSMPSWWDTNTSLNHRMQLVWE